MNKGLRGIQPTMRPGWLTFRHFGENIDVDQPMIYNKNERAVLPPEYVSKGIKWYWKSVACGLRGSIWSV